MANTLIWGFGGVMIQDTFGGAMISALASGSLWFEDESNSYKTIGGTSYKKPAKWRPYIEVTMFNITDTDYSNILDFLAIINNVNALAPSIGYQSAAPITVFPRYDTLIETGISYDCNCVSNMNPKDVHINGKGQVFTVKFEGVNTINVLPMLTNGGSVVTITSYDGSTITSHIPSDITGIIGG